MINTYYKHLLLPSKTGLLFRLPYLHLTLTDFNGQGQGQGQGQAHLKDKNLVSSDKQDTRYCRHSTYRRSISHLYFIFAHSKV